MAQQEPAGALGETSYPKVGAPQRRPDHDYQPIGNRLILRLVPMNRAVAGFVGFGPGSGCLGGSDLLEGEAVGRHHPH